LLLLPEIRTGDVSARWPWLSLPRPVAWLLGGAARRRVWLLARSSLIERAPQCFVSGLCEFGDDVEDCFEQGITDGLTNGLCLVFEALDEAALAF
jgi:hypothetical protein